MYIPLHGQVTVTIGTDLFVPLHSTFVAQPLFRFVTSIPVVVLTLYGCYIIRTVVNTSPVFYFLSLTRSCCLWYIRHRNVVYTTAVIPRNPCSTLPSEKKKPKDVPWTLLLFQRLWFGSFENQSRLVPCIVFLFFLMCDSVYLSVLFVQKSYGVELEKKNKKTSLVIIVCCSGATQRDRHYNNISSNEFDVPGCNETVKT